MKNAPYLLQSCMELLSRRTRNDVIDAVTADTVGASERAGLERDLIVPPSRPPSRTPARPNAL